MIETPGQGPGRGNLMRELGILEPTEDPRKVLCSDGSVLILDDFMHRPPMRRAEAAGPCLRPDLEWKPFKEAIGTNRDMAGRWIL